MEQSSQAERMKAMYLRLRAADAEIEKLTLPFGESTPLEEAVYSRDLARVTQLIDGGADVNAETFFESTPLHAAVELSGNGGDHPNLALHRLTLNNIADKVTAAGNVAGWLKKAPALPSANEIGDMIRSSRDRSRREADATPESRSTPASDEDLALLRLLIERGADLNRRDKGGQTPFHLAASAGKLEAAELLLAHGANLEDEDNEGSTPLMAASSQCRPAMVHWLLENGASPKLCTSLGGTALMAAARGGSLRIVEMLLNHGSEVNARSESGTTALLVALMQGYGDVADQLRAAGAMSGALESLVLGDMNLAVERVNADKTIRPPTWGRTVLFWAARSSRPEVIRFLFRHGVSTDMQNSRGRTPIMDASMRADQETVRALLDCGASPSPKLGERSLSPLRSAVTSGDIGKVRELIAAKVDVNESSQHSVTPLAAAVTRGNVEVVRALLLAGADPNPGAGGTSPAALAAHCGETQIVKLLAEHGARLDGQWAPGAEPRRVPLEILPPVKKNVEMMSVIRATTGTDLHEAVRAGDPVMVRDLLDRRRDVNGRDSRGVTPMFAAVESGQAAMIVLLLDRGADPNARGPAGSTAMHMAVGKENMAAAHALAERGASLDAVSDSGYTPLLTAAILSANGRNAMAAWLLEAGAHVRLQEAAGLGDLEAVRSLLELGLPVDEANSGGLTPLMTSADAGHTEVLSLLIARGAQVDLRDSMGHTALTHASTRGQAPAAVMLLNAGADVNGAAGLHQDPELGVDFGITHTPLQAAVGANRRDLVEMLLDRGANLDLRGMLGHTALHTAGIMAGSVELIDLLLDRGAQIDAPDWSGETPLMTASILGRLDAVKLFIARGADSSLRGRFGQTALQRARLGGMNDEVVRLLEEAQVGGTGGRQASRRTTSN